MLTFSTAQLRFSNSLSKNSKQQPALIAAVNTSFRKKSSLKIKSSKPQSIIDDSNLSQNNYDEVPLSIEYVQLLEKTLSPDEEDFLHEAVSSRLAQPLDAKSVFCPNASLLSSKYVAPRITALDATKDDLNPNPIDALTDAKSRLNVLWLRRKADLFREEGNYFSAVATLEEAIEEHLGVGADYKEMGTEAYLKANLSQPALSSDPVEILSGISKNMFLFDQSVHLLAGKIQRSYHRRYLFKQRTSTMIARIFRGHLCRRRIRKEREVQRQCAVIIQRRFRIHLRRMHALATKLKRWYFLRKDVKAYQRKLRVYQMARRIQRLFRGNRGKPPCHCPCSCPADVLVIYHLCAARPCGGGEEEATARRRPQNPAPLQTPRAPARAGLPPRALPQTVLPGRSQNPDAGPPPAGSPESAGPAGREGCLFGSDPLFVSYIYVCVWCVCPA